MSNQLRFSAADRMAIAAQVIGKPTGVVVEVGGFSFDLVPLTVKEARDFFELADFFVSMQMQSQNGQVTLAPGDLGKEAARMRALLRSTLYNAALSADMVDKSDAGEEVFDEWFGALPFMGTLKTLGPPMLQAQGLSNFLGNPSTPPEKTATT